MAKRATCPTSCLNSNFGEYERTGMKLDDAIKVAVLMTGQPKAWLQLNVAEAQDYSRLREAIVQYDSATLKWNNARMLGQEVNKDVAVPMEADRIMDKGEKSGKTGKGKGKERKTKESKRVASKAARAQVSRKGKIMEVVAKANRRAHGRKSKGSCAGMLRMLQASHPARDCWRKVRQVVDSQGSPSDKGTTVTTSEPGNNYEASWHQAH